MSASTEMNSWLFFNAKRCWKIEGKAARNQGPHKEQTLQAPQLTKHFRSQTHGTSRNQSIAVTATRPRFWTQETYACVYKSTVSTIEVKQTGTGGPKHAKTRTSDSPTTAIPAKARETKATQPSQAGRPCQQQKWPGPSLPTTLTKPPEHM